MKKTTTNNRRKKLPLLLGALLIISVAAYGTRAYFSDSATEQADIKLSLGNLDIQSYTYDDPKGWTYAPLNGKFNNVLVAGEGTVKDGKMPITDDVAKDITNVQPGDQFERIFSFKNVGTLEQNVKVNTTVLSDEDSIFDVKLERVDNSGNAFSEQEAVTTIKKDVIVDYKMTISVKTIDSTDSTDSFNKRYNQKNNIVLETGTTVFDALSNNETAETLLENAVTVTATQVNAPIN